VTQTLKKKIRWKNISIDPSELEDRRLSCFSSNLGLLVIREWINDLLNENLPNELDAFYDAIKDGTVLCRAANVLKRGCIKRMNAVPHMAIEATENIESFLAACKELGLNGSELFSINDLLNAENIPKVIATLSTLMYLRPANNQNSLQDSQTFNNESEYYINT